MTDDAFAKLLAGMREYGILRSIIGLMSLIRAEIMKPQEVIVSTRSDQLKLSFKYPSQVVPTLIVYREFVQSEYRFLHLTVERDSTFFDVGGGIGTYTIWVSKRVSRPIHTFEPVAANFETIKKNIQANHSVSDAEIRLNAIALSSSEGFASMHSQRGSLFNSQLSNISDKPSADAVPVTTLDKYCQRNDVSTIDILKLDVEDHSPAIIAGAQDLLSRRAIGIIIIELYSFSSTAFYKSIISYGFRCFYYDKKNNALLEIVSITEGKLTRSRPSPLNRSLIFVRDDLVSGLIERLSWSRTIA